MRKWTNEVYIETFHWCVCRGCKTMCMNGDFQHDNMDSDQCNIGYVVVDIPKYLSNP